MLKTAAERVANLLNEGTPTHQLPPEILTRILYLAVDHDSEAHTEQVIPLTHVCRYWRALLLSYPRMWSTICMKPGNPSLISEWLARSQKVPLTIIAEFSDAYEHPPCRYKDSTTMALADFENGAGEFHVHIGDIRVVHDLEVLQLRGRFRELYQHTFEAMDG